MDILPPGLRRKLGSTYNGMNMGECLSMPFPEDETAILKVGMDEVIFKMYATNQSSWEADGVKKISHKGD